MNERITNFSIDTIRSTRAVGRFVKDGITSPAGARVLLATLIGGAGGAMQGASISFNYHGLVGGHESFNPAGMPSLNAGVSIGHAQEVPTPKPYVAPPSPEVKPQVTPPSSGLPSESPLVPEQGKTYTTIADRSNDEQRYLIDHPEILIDGTPVQPGDCLKVIEAIDTVTQVQGGPNHITYRHLFRRCAPESQPVEVPPQSEKCVDYEFQTGPWRIDGLTDSLVGHGDFWVETSEGLVRTFDVGFDSGNTGSITEIIPNGQSFSAHGDYGADLYCNRDGSIRSLNIDQGVANLQSQGKRPLVNVLEYNTSTGRWDFHPRSQ